MKIFFDFDDFFLDTENALVPETFNHYVIVTGATLGDVYETYTQFSRAKAESGRCYNIETHLEYLKKYSDFDLDEALQKMKSFLNDTRRYLYSGAIDFLQKMNKKDIFLLTYGDDDFQMMKVRGAGIEGFFRGVFVTQGDKIEEIAKLRRELGIASDEMVVFCDNRCEYFAGAKEAGLITIHLKRAEDKASDNPCGECQYRVSNFDELGEVLKKLE
jgi:FMN phosphatase YigB (HAD superfamily)